MRHDEAFWTRLALAGAGVVAVVLALALASWARDYGPGALAEARTRFEAEVGSLDLATYALPEVPEERNAATWIVRAAAMLPSARSGHTTWTEALKPVYTSLDTWSETDVAKLRGALTTYAPALETVSRARGLRESTFHIEVTYGTGARIPDFYRILLLSKLLAGRARLNARDGDTRGTIDDLEALGAIADALYREPVTLSAMIGSACERLETGVIRDVVERYEASRGELRRLDSALPDADLLAAAARMHAFDAAALAKAFDEILADQPVRDMLGPRGLVARYGTMRRFAGFLEFHRELAPLLRRPWPEFCRAVDDLRARIEAEYPPDTLFLSEGLVKTTYGRLKHVRSLRRIARTALALRQAGAAGRYPGTLEGLDSAAGMDPLTGGSMVWTILPDGGGRLEVPVDHALIEQLFGKKPIDPGVAVPWTLPPPRDKSSLPARRIR